MQSITLKITLLVTCLSCQQLSAEAVYPPVTDVFVSKTDGFANYRIPSIIRAKNSDLLAIAEARAGYSDQAANKLVLKRSSDGGSTWGPLQIVADDGDNSLNNPTAVVLRESGRILLMYQRYPQGVGEFKVIEGLTGDKICRSFLIRSDDHGSTWSKPQDVTASVKRPTVVTSMASGPGIGIELARGPHAGRILIPFNQGPKGEWKVYAAYSDDGGATWKYGQTAPAKPTDKGNEVQMVELGDGSVMLNARKHGGTVRCRTTAISHDGGESWSELADDSALVDPRCQGSIIRHPGKGDLANDVLIFSNAASAAKRTDGTVRLSRDDGKTWIASRKLIDGDFAYSCLVSLDAQSVGCLFEHDKYRKISFCRFTIDWLRGE